MQGWFNIYKIFYFGYLPIKQERNRIFIGDAKKKSIHDNIDICFV